MDSEKEKTFDAVNMMRDIRDKISKETMDMNFEELKKYISGRLNKTQVAIDKKIDYS